MNEADYTNIEIGDGETVTQCNFCGAHVINQPPSAIKHHTSCDPSEDIDRYFDDSEEDG